MWASLSKEEVYGVVVQTGLQFLVFIFRIPTCFILGDRLRKAKRAHVVVTVKANLLSYLLKTLYSL